MAESATAEKPNRMEKRRLNTRARLLDATLQLILENGIDKTTMDAITNTADLGRRTLYYHFSSKEECIQAAAAREFAKYAAEAERAPPPDADSALLVALHGRSVLAALLDDPLTARLAEYPKLLAAALDDAVAAFALRDIRFGVESGRFTPPTGERLLDRLLIWSLTGLLVEYGEQPVEKDELLSAYTVLVLTNLGISAAEAADLDQLAAGLSAGA